MTVLCGGSALGADWQSVASIRLLGGQYAFRGERAGMSGNLKLRGAVAAVFNPRWSLLGSLDTEYEGTKPLSQPVGPGTLFQQRMTHAVGIKPVYSPENSRWRFKPSLRYRMELLKETRDEFWNKGLFDSQSAVAGFEIELPQQEQVGFRLGLDYSVVIFPRYRTLESKSKVDFNGAPLARELAGDRILDYSAQTLYTALSSPFPLIREARFHGAMSFERRRFGSQPVVGGDGLLTGRSRIDLITRASGQITVGREIRRELRIVPGLRLTAAATVSNQSRYDAAQGVFSPRYYNLFEMGIAPSVALELGDDRRPVVVAFETGWTRRSWGHRKAQTASGRTIDESAEQSLWNVSLRLNYPLGTRLRFIGEVETSGATSNQNFEQFYRYNYTALSVLTGLGIEF